MDKNIEGHEHEWVMARSPTYQCKLCGLYRLDINFKRTELNSAIDMAMAMKECLTGGLHICRKDPDSCEFWIKADRMKEMRK